MVPADSGVKASSSLARSSILGGQPGHEALADFALPTDTPTPTPEPTETLEPTPTPEPPAQAVEIAAKEPEPSPTPEPEPPTPTPEPPSPTPTPVPPTSTPTPTPLPPTPTATVRPTATPRSGTISGTVSRYADSLEGNTLGCSQFGTYDPDNPLIIAVSAARHAEWPCGTQLEVCGTISGGGCIIGVRADSCPGCGADHIDMSRAGVMAVCGNATGCTVTIRKR